MIASVHQKLSEDNVVAECDVAVEDNVVIVDDNVVVEENHIELLVEVEEAVVQDNRTCIGFRKDKRPWTTKAKFGSAYCRHHQDQA